MISVNAAREILAGHSHLAPKKELDLVQSLGLVVAEDVHSPISVPSFDNSAMDGYAMTFDDSRSEWKVVAKIQAGDSSPYNIGEGEAARIYTGAKIPEGADTVIPQELIEKTGETAIRYEGDKIRTGSNVRLKASQCKKGDLILEKGSTITAGTVGLLASVGLKKVLVYAPPSIGIILTGNELKEPGEELAEGEIYNSNGPMLEACLERTGISDRVVYRAGDDKEDLQQIIDDALELHQVLILSGGISVGDYDFVRECLQQSGVKELYYKVKQRPGKPMYAGKKNDSWVFALPGNPASVLSCYYEYVRPCLRHLMGHSEVWQPYATLPLITDVSKKPGLTFFIKGKITDGKAEVLGGQQSFNLLSFNEATCLVELEEQAEKVKAGTPVNITYL